MLIYYNAYKLEKYLIKPCSFENNNLIKHNKILLTL